MKYENVSNLMFDPDHGYSLKGKWDLQAPLLCWGVQEARMRGCYSGRRELETQVCSLLDGAQVKFREVLLYRMSKMITKQECRCFTVHGLTLYLPDKLRVLFYDLEEKIKKNLASTCQALVQAPQLMVPVFVKHTYTLWRKDIFSL